MHRFPFARVLFGLTLSLSIGACAPASRAFDANAESAALMRRDANWANLAAAGKDVDGIVSYWTDDAVVMEPGQPAVEGKPAIRAYVASSLQTPGFRIHWVSGKPTFSADGTMAYMRSTDDMTVPVPKGEPVTMHLQGYSVWRKEADGQWRCAVDIATESPPTAGASGK
jgi:ketosteroid isomerase-like protein